MLGAMDELKLGDPIELATDIGPVIDEDARASLADHADKMKREAKLLRELAVAAGVSRTASSSRRMRSQIDSHRS